MACCKRCGSNETKTEILIPTSKIDELKGTETEQSAEIFCKKCGKIDRTKIKIKIE
ncbi:MAG: hypothetical protein J7L08_00565 [Candidatus Aenigmarchaeota archaeon]|nr:hypothetical protein [Candidatus Aenigmarchaeota archaeon]